MGDLLIQGLLFPLCVISLFASIYVTKRTLNPVFLIVLFFFIPACFATLRLSGLQVKEWEWATYGALWLAAGAWLGFPLIYCMSRGVPKTLNGVSGVVYTHQFKLIYRVFVHIVIGAYWVSNFIQAGTPLPILVPELAYQLHTEFPPFLRLFARCIPLIVGLTYIVFYAGRKKYDLILLCIAILTPLSRLSRIDVALSLVVLLVLFSVLPIVKVNYKRILMFLIISSTVIVGAVELGNQRTNRFGTYEVKYERAIKWNSDYAGPAGVFAVMYGYFPLSFENLDSYIRQDRGGGDFTGASISWFLVGAVKLNWLGGDAVGGVKSFVPISSAANVPTALHPFVSDFGILGVVLPGIFYMFFWVWLFYKSGTNTLYLILFSVYTAAFSLASFQALIVAPIIFHQLVAAVIIFKLAEFSAVRGRTIAQSYGEGVGVLHNRLS